MPRFLNRGGAAGALKKVRLNIDRYMKDKKEEYLWLKETKDIKRNGKKVLDGRR